jgi:signal transduction histidine kinase
MSPAEEAERARYRTSMRRAIAQYALSGIGVVILLGAAGVYVMRKAGEREAIRSATQLAEVAGRGAIAPVLTTGLLHEDPAAIALVDRVVRRGVLNDRVVRVKVWAPDGRIIYSDAHELIGARYKIDRSEFTSGKTKAEISDLARPENRLERRFDKLLEVYLPIRGPDGKPLLFELYERYSSISASGRKLWGAFAPAMMGALAVLWLIQLPLAWRGARQLREGQAERERLLQRAIQSSELERRRIARDLHDGAVQDLAGVSYSLTAAADRLDRSSRDETALTLRDAASGTRRTIRELRSLLVDIYPPDLHRAGLEAAFRDLVAPLAPRGMEANVELPKDLSLPPALEMLFYRCAQEALRNVTKHSEATHVEVRVELEPRLARLIVQDNGRGFDGQIEDGHLGLLLVTDLVREAGGRLEIDSTPESGTRVCVEVPR